MDTQERKICIAKAVEILSRSVNQCYHPWISGCGIRDVTGAIDCPEYYHLEATEKWCLTCSLRAIFDALDK